MSGYTPLQVVGNSVGLVQNREEFLLPNDAYPTLINAYVWRERIKRKQGWEKLGRLRRTFADQSLGLSGASPWSFNIYSTLSSPITPEPNAQIEQKSVMIDITTVIKTGAISAYLQSINCIVISVGHGLSTGNVITISGVNVVPDTGDNAINGGVYTITVQNVDTFTLNVNSLTWGKYSSGGTWTTVSGGSNQLADDGLGNLIDSVGAATGTVNYNTGDVTITGGVAGQPSAISFNYFPGLPVMGIRLREVETINIQQTVFFDTKYSYEYNNGFQEFVPGTTWSGADYQLFWTTNYWISSANQKVIWATNGTVADGIKYTDGQVGNTWINFTPQFTSTDPTDIVNAAKIIIPFRGRLVLFNTVEKNISYPNRIRWAAIGNPFSVASAIVTSVNMQAWFDDIRGQGGFQDIPTTEDIITVGFVRDNLIIYCEHSTWQLRYTGRSIAPFQIEKVNSELGSQSPLGGVQFDTSLMTIGDKGMTDCDSFQAERIDIKIPDFVQTQISNINNGPLRISGVRDFLNKLAYWNYPSRANNLKFPDSRLIYNYENDSWAIFTDSLTVLGTFQVMQGPTWISDPDLTWDEANFTWFTQQLEFPAIVGGNQQGYVGYLDQLTTNNESLFIKDITGNEAIGQPTVLTVPSHNLVTGQIIKIVNIPSTSSFNNLDNQIFSIISLSDDTFSLFVYNPMSDVFDIPQIDPSGTYIGCGEIQVRDNFNIVSKRFNFMDEGQKIQLGYIDILTNSTEAGAFTLQVFEDYQDPIGGQASNQYPLNESKDGFFNTIVSTSPQTFGINGQEKQFSRIFCPTNSNFLTISWTLSNAQMIGVEEESDVQIDAMIIYSRPGGRQGITL